MYEQAAELSRMMMLITNKQKNVLNHLIRNMGYTFEFAHFKLLLTIVHYPKEVYAKDLAEFEGKSKSTINALLKKMEHLNLIEMIPKVEDKRHKIIVITKEGERIYQQISENIAQFIFPNIVLGVSLEEQEQTQKVLQKILINLDNLLEKE